MTVQRLAVPFVFILSFNCVAGAAENSPPGLECRPVEGTYQLTTMPEGKSLGRPIAELSVCQESIAASKHGVVCALKAAEIKGWMAVNIERGHWIGRYPVTRQDCFEATRNASEGVVCGHTGLTLDNGKLGFKPTNIAKPDDQGFMGSSAWLDFCKIATRSSHDGKVCANGNGGTGDHPYWYQHWIASNTIVSGTSSGTVENCSASLRITDTGFVNIMPAGEAETFKRLLPRVDDAAIDQLLSSPQTMWYDGRTIVPGYQDSMGDPKGFRPNTIESILIDLAVPGGWSRLFQERGRFNFPFATGGADQSKNFTKINFWAPPRQDGKVVPVAYWKLNFSHWRWLFPVGTRLGEVMMVRYPDGELRVFEIRVRTRELDRWNNTIFRPFLTASDLADMIKSLRPGWNEEASLRQAVQHLLNSNSLVAKSLSTVQFKGTFETVNGHVDEIPDFGDDALAKDLLQYSQFHSVGSVPWKTSGAKVTHAASTRSLSSIVPQAYDGGLLPVTNDSCIRCHKEAARQIQDFHPQLAAYGELWGEDETFSWHPFETSMFVNAQGNVQNFNDDNRRMRSDFSQAQLVKSYGSSAPSDSNYKMLPREWVYNPFRGKDR